MCRKYSSSNSASERDPPVLERVDGTVLAVEERTAVLDLRECIGDQSAGDDGRRDRVPRVSMVPSRTDASWRNPDAGGGR
jgi:hypothetical protein